MSIFALILRHLRIEIKNLGFLRAHTEIYSQMASGRPLISNPVVVEFATTYAISAYHHWCCEFESQSGRGVQHYVIKFVSDLRLVCGFLQFLHQ
jgi:hypothetical protein